MIDNILLKMRSSRVDQAYMIVENSHSILSFSIIVGRCMHLHTENILTQISKMWMRNQV